MSALAAARTVLVPKGTIKKFTAPLKAGIKAYENSIACIDTASAGSVTNGQSGVSTLKPIGWFTQTVDNSAGGTTVPIGVELFQEKDVAYWDSVTGAGAITASNLFSQVYIASDHEVTTTQGSNSAYGYAWVYGVQGYPNAVGVVAGAF
jgi:hypothetical protein